jgi:hypothetical protein
MCLCLSRLDKHPRHAGLAHIHTTSSEGAADVALVRKYHACKEPFALASALAWLTNQGFTRVQALENVRDSQQAPCFGVWLNGVLVAHLELVIPIPFERASGALIPRDAVARTCGLRDPFQRQRIVCTREVACHTLLKQQGACWLDKSGAMHKNKCLATTRQGRY